MAPAVNILYVSCAPATATQFYLYLTAGSAPYTTPRTQARKHPLGLSTHEVRTKADILLSTKWCLCLLYVDGLFNTQGENDAAHVRKSVFITDVSGF